MSNLTLEPEVSEAKIAVILSTSSRLAELIDHYGLLAWRARQVLWRLSRDCLEDPSLAAAVEPVAAFYQRGSEYRELLPEGWHWDDIAAQVRAFVQSADDAPLPPHIRDAVADVGPPADAVYFNPSKRGPE